MSTLYLIRHGQASFGTADYDRLSPTGMQQVAHLREHLQASAGLPEQLFSGRLRRQRETAAILAGDAQVALEVHPAFDEYDADALLRLHAAAAPGSHAATEHGTASVDPRAFQRRLESAGLAWVEGVLDDHCPETWATFRARVARGLESLMAREGRGRRWAVCTSAGVIGAAVGHVLGLADREALRLSWSIHNASITRLQYDGSRVSLLTFNAVPHLEQPGRLGMITYR